MSGLASSPPSAVRGSTWGGRLVGYPEDAVHAYRAAGLWGTRTIPDELHQVALAHPDRPAVIALDGELTYRELDERTDLLAAATRWASAGPATRCPAPDRLVATEKFDDFPGPSVNTLLLAAR